MYAPDQVPEGPHHVYIFYDESSSRFKIGESRRVDKRRTEVAREVLSWRLRRTLKEYHRWTFQNYYAGIHVEQATINLLKLHGFLPVRKPDWFEIDKPTIDAAIKIIDGLAKSVIDWETKSCGVECIATYQGTPYGDYVHDTDSVTRGHIWENDDGGIEYDPPNLRRAIADKKRFYQTSRRKMPDGLARLIADNDISS